MLAQIKNQLKKVLPVPYRKYAESRQKLAVLEEKAAEWDRKMDGLVEAFEMRFSNLRRIACQALNAGDHEPPPCLAPDSRAPDIEECFRRLQAIVPHAFGIWRKLMQVNGDHYVGFPIDSCAVAGHAMAPRFAAFLAPYLRGAVLDIGCGPQPVPSYLEHYPLDRIAAIDPLPPPTPHPFAFFQGVSEFLPWPDETFRVVVASTSLDHVLLLDKSFDEITRVLKKGGLFVTWVSFVPGARPYDPYRTDIQAIDKFHLFHFDVPWYDEFMSRYFVELERTDLPGSSFISYQVRK